MRFARSLERRDEGGLARALGRRVEDDLGLPELLKDLMKVKTA